MISIKIQKGEFSDLDEYSLYIDSNIVFKGYNYELITSESGFIELRMNSILEDDIIRFKVTRYYDFAILIPCDFFQLLKRIPTFFINFDDLEGIWKKFGFDFKDDEPLILNTTMEDVKDCWLSMVDFKRGFYGKEELIQYLSENLFAISCSEMKNLDLENLLLNDWVENYKSFSILINSVNVHYCTAYIGSGEWKFAKKIDDKLYLNLGSNFYAELQKGVDQ